MYDPEKEWVSEPGTSRVMALAQEPHSINEQQQGGQYSTEVEPPEHPEDDAASKGSPEPTKSADQQEAAMKAASGTVSSLSSVVKNTTGIESSRNARLVVYVVVALVGLSLVSEAL